MGSSYLGKPNLGGSERSSSSSSSRKGKKNNSEKPKQPQRGLGVAQLEKIRLHGQLPACAYHPNSLHHSPTPYPPSNFNNINMGLPEYEQTHMRYGDSQPRWEHPNGILENQYSAQSNITRPFLNLYDSQDHLDICKKHRSGSLGSSSQNSEPSDSTQELDLELRLSL
ncbi:hypothetical protein SESBI_03405 [Sesbania bispinosa]|nr:hypothetical protein SESBI_03405 [Sesbania bispinosa]